MQPKCCGVGMIPPLGGTGWVCSICGNTTQQDAMPEPQPGPFCAHKCPCGFRYNHNTGTPCPPRCPTCTKGKKK